MQFGVKFGFAGLLRPALLTAVMAGVVAAVAPLSWIVAVLAGVLAFGGLSILSGSVPREARRLLALRHRVRRWLH